MKGDWLISLKMIIGTDRFVMLMLRNNNVLSLNYDNKIPGNCSIIGQRMIL